jgi:hypothetical protein
LYSLADVLSFLSEELNVFVDSSEEVFDLEIAQRKLDCVVGIMKYANTELDQLKVKLGEAGILISQIKMGA